MDFDFSKIEEIYGKETVTNIKDNIEKVTSNINYLIYLGFNDTEDLFERETLLFLYDNETFKNKINQLIKKLGPNYVNIIEDDISQLEELLW